MGEAIIEASKNYDSQFNGIAERAVQTAEGQVRPLLLALESRLEPRLKGSMVRWLSSGEE